MYTQSATLMFMCYNLGTALLFTGIWQIPAL